MKRDNRFWNGFEFICLLGLALIGYFVTDAAYWNGRAAGFNEGLEKGYAATCLDTRTLEGTYGKGRP